MKLQDFGYSKEPWVEHDPPACGLAAELEEYGVDSSQFQHAVLVNTLDSSKCRYWVFYFFRGEIDRSSRPDDVFSFGVPFSDPSQIFEGKRKYLGGCLWGAKIAPPLDVADGWDARTSPEGVKASQKMEELKRAGKPVFGPHNFGEEDPAETTALILRERVEPLLQEKRYDEAMPLLQMMIEIDPNSEYAAFSLAGVYRYHFKDLSQAEKWMEKCTQIDPSRGDHWGILGQDRYEQGKIAEAIAAYEEALRRGVGDRTAGIRSRVEQLKSTVSGGSSVPTGGSSVGSAAKSSGCAGVLAVLAVMAASALISLVR